MESMFNKLTSEYGSKNATWNFSPPSSPLAISKNSSRDNDESSKTEVDKNMKLMAEEEAEEERKLKEQVQGMMIMNIFFYFFKKSINPFFSYFNSSLSHLI